MLRIKPLAIAAIFCAANCLGSQHPNIRTFNFQRYFNQRFPECVHSGERKAVEIVAIGFHDFAGDGSEEAMLVGSSCNTGTAGPDIHSVFRLNSEGQIKELKINEPSASGGRPPYADLIGNRNFVFEVQGTSLCQVFHDASGRDKPLTLCYRLRGDEFVLDRVKKGPVYKTSFDCSKAQSASARTVCGTKELAASDMELHATYDKLLSQLDPDRRAALEAEQRSWEKSLSDASGYKDYGGYLRDAYTDRIKALQSKLK
jgi:hypothetical protein